MKRISVCMATYNGERTILQQLQSILSQLCAEDEIVISDDSSIDNTVNLIHSLQDSRIRLYRQENNLGIVKNFENALIQSRNEIIFLSDQDDIWMSNKVTRIKEYLDLCDLVIHDCTIINDAGEIVFPSFFDLNRSNSGIIKNILSNSYMGCCMAFNRKILAKSLPFPKNIRAYDQWIGLVAETYFKVRFLKEKLIQYRRHGLNYSSTSTKSSLSFIEKVSYRFGLIYNLRRV